MNGAVYFAELVVWRMEKRHHVKPFLVHDVSFMAERLESVKAVVVPGSAHADTAKRNF